MAYPGEIKDRWHEYEERYEEVVKILGQALEGLVELEEATGDLFAGGSEEARKVGAGTAAAAYHVREAVTDVEAAVKAGDEYVQWL
jgi:hypothetical protein